MKLGAFAWVLFAGAAALAAGAPACGGDDGSPSGGGGAGGSGRGGGGGSGAEGGAGSGAGPAAGGGGVAGGPACAAAITTAGARGSDAPSMVRSSYDYAPSVIHDGVWRMWWCGGVAGDHVLYAEADSLDGPWHAFGSAAPGTYDDVFQPTGNTADFDGTHTCDPSVVRVDGTYYLYYGGYPLPADGETTRIGVASSDTGRAFTRLNGGLPIVVPARDFTSVPNRYGAGQPSITVVDGLFYLAFTDTTGLDANPGNGAGIFVLRSADPTFQAGVEELGASGFAPYDAATHTAHKLLESFSIDWQYIDGIDAFAVASDNVGGQTVVHLFDKSLTSELGTAGIPGAWTEGPGLASRPDKHAVPGAGCGVVPFDVMQSVGPSGPDTWDLAHDGVDLTTGLDCGCWPTARAFEGELLQVNGLPLTLVRGGQRLQFEVLSTATHFGRSTNAVSPDTFNAVPYGASLHAGAEVLGAPGRPAAFHLDDGRLWPVSCLEAITDNGSSITQIAAADWDAIPLGPSLYCLK